MTSALFFIISSSTKPLFLHFCWWVYVYYPAKDKKPALRFRQASHFSSYGIHFEQWCWGACAVLPFGQKLSRECACLHIWNDCGSNEGWIFTNQRLTGDRTKAGHNSLKTTPGNTQAQVWPPIRIYRFNFYLQWKSVYRCTVVCFCFYWLRGFSGEGASVPFDICNLGIIFCLIASS